MKKIASVFMVAAMLTSGVAKADMLSILKEYGLPCAAGLAGGFLASKDHGAAIGIGVCLGVGTATYLQADKASEKMKEEDFKKFMVLMDEHAAKSSVEQEERINKTIKSMEEKQASQIDAVRQVMKEVIAERIALISEETRSDMKRYIEKADFMENLEKKVMQKMKEEVQFETKLRQKEVVSECVDESLRQLVMKKVGSPTE